jgi:hypothetical protein
MIVIDFCINQLKNPCNKLLFNDKSDFVSNIIVGDFDENDFDNDDFLTSSYLQGQIEITLSFLPNGYTNPVVLEFVAIDGIVTQATRTDQNGNVSNILGELTTVNFPFVNLELSSLLLYGSQSFEDVRNSIEYLYVYNGNTYKKTSTLVTLCGVIQCYNDASSKYTQKKIQKDRYVDLAAKFYALTSSIYTGDINNIDTNLESIKKACNNCGCGC